MKLVVLIIFCLFITESASASPRLNELSPATDPEWVELYNPDLVAYDLTGWKIEDDDNSADLELTGILAPGQYLVFEHPKGWLADSGDTLSLIASPSATLDTYSYTQAETGTTIARSPATEDEWLYSMFPTPGALNSLPSPSPSPSPSLAASPHPPSPSPSPTPTPTPSPSPLPSRSSPSPKPAPSLNSEPEGGTVAGTSTIDFSAFSIDSPVPFAPAVSSAPSPADLTPNRNHLRVVLTSATGLLFLATSGYFGYRRFRTVNPPVG